MEPGDRPRQTSGASEAEGATAEDENEAQSEDVADPTEQGAGTVRKHRPEKAECADACCPSLTGNPGMA